MKKENVFWQNDCSQLPASPWLGPNKMNFLQIFDEAKTFDQRTTRIGGIWKAAVGVGAVFYAARNCRYFGYYF